ncbi:MAG TPA: biopolymer transporter ExbD [Terriglobia bacterium]|nr:biopolymer transporter ExbD [Terriglobia bacterium]
MGMGGGGDRGAVNADINVTPMADVMLVMLIIFMVVTPMLQKGAPVDLPHTKNPLDMADADKDDAIRVGVSRDGKFYLGQERIVIDDLTAKVDDLLKDRTGDKTVYVKADFRAKYGDVVKVVDAIRTSGVDRVGLLSEKLDEEIKK